MTRKRTPKDNRTRRPASEETGATEGKRRGLCGEEAENVGWAKTKGK